MRNSFSCPVLGFQDTRRERVSCCAFQAGRADPNSLNVMGDGVPTSFEVFHAPQEIVSIQSLAYGFLDSHSSQNNPHSSNAAWMEFVVESLLQGKQHPAEGKTEF